MRDRIFSGIKGSFRPFIFLGALLLVLIAAPAYAQMTVTATATPTSGPAPLLVTFGSTVTGGTSPYTYLWTFGDGQTDTSATPTHTYDTAGTYAVTLAVTDSTAPTPLTVTINVATIRVYLGVTIEADYPCGLPPLNVCFTSGAEGGIAPYSYTWSFGDGAPANNTTSACPCHGFESCGRYTVTLSVRDAAGNTGSASMPITVFDFSITPVADVIYGVADLRVNFTAAPDFFCGPSFGPIDCVDYEWDFGDGSDAVNNCNPQHIYNTEGTYTVTLKLTIECGGSTFERSGTTTVTVVPDPTVIITSPSDYGEWVGPTATIQSEVYTKSTVTRVDYFVDGSYIGSSSVAPYRLTLDICGASGIYKITAIAYTASGTSSTSDAVNVVVNNPTLDGTSFVLKNPYRVKFYGTGLKIGAKAYINGVEAPVTKVLNSNTVIIKGGRVLKNMMPEGVPVLVSLVNLDGGCTNTITFQR